MLDRMVKNLERQLREAHQREVELNRENGKISAELEDCQEKCDELKAEVARGVEIRAGLREELERMTQRVIELNAMLRHPSQVGPTSPVDPADQEL